MIAEELPADIAARFSTKPFEAPKVRPRYNLNLDLNFIGAKSVSPELGEENRTGVLTCAQVRLSTQRWRILFTLARSSSFLSLLLLRHRRPVRYDLLAKLLLPVLKQEFRLKVRILGASFSSNFILVYPSIANSVLKAPILNSKRQKKSGSGWSSVSASFPLMWHPVLQARTVAAHSLSAPARLACLCPPPACLVPARRPPGRE